MKILFWMEYFWPNIGGIEVVTLQLLLGLKARGVDCAVVTTQSNPPLPEEEEYSGIPIYRLPFPDGLLGDLRAYKRIRESLFSLKQKIRPDLIHIHSCGPTIFYEFQTRNAHPCPVLLTVHGLLSEPTKDSFIVKYLRSVDRITGVSRAALDYALRFAGDLSCPHSVVYNGLSFPDLPPSPLEWETPRILMLGRLSPEKGFDVGLEAYSLLKKSHPSARLLIAGQGREQESLSARARELGLQGSVDFLGWIAPENIYRTLNRASLVLVPSRSLESFSLAALQGAQMGRPVVATRRGGLPEVVLHGETGLLVESENPEEMAQAMDRLISDPSRADSMGRAAHQRAKTTFSVQRMVEEYESVYHALLKK